MYFPFSLQPHKHKQGGYNGSRPAHLDISNEVSGGINVSSPDKRKADSDALHLEVY